MEWLDIDGLPLAIQKNVMRMPVTPGNLFIDQICLNNRIILAPKELCHILVISALKRSDPIRRCFEEAFDIFSKNWKDELQVEFIDVSNEQEFIDAVNNFSGNLMVFDGHGGHESNAPAALYLHDNPVNVWQLRKKISRMPPIVILSACDTHAADRNHATTANGFLALGARAVLASVFPLYAPTAASFTARLLFRVAKYVGATIRLFERSISWLDVVSGMLRMQLLTDFLQHLTLKKMITHENYLHVHNLGNTAINGGDPNPFSTILDALVELGIKRTDLTRELEFTVANSSAISYLHVGRPETIIIADSACADELIKVARSCRNELQEAL